MVSLKNTIQKTRQKFKSTEEKLQTTGQQVKPATRRELMAGGLQTLATRRQKKGVRKQISKTKGKLSEQETKFERDVARKAPAQAKPEFLRKAYQEVKTEADKKISRLKKEIEREKDRIERTKKKKREADSESREERYSRDIEESEDDIDIAQKELRALKKGITGPKTNVVKDWFSGRTQTEINNARIEEKNRQARLEQRKALGFKSQTEFIKSKPILQKIRGGKEVSLKELESLPYSVRKKTGLQGDVTDLRLEKIKWEKKLKEKGKQEVLKKGAFENIITGEKVSTAFSPGPLFKDITPGRNILEKARLNKKPEKKDSSFLEKIERAIPDKTVGEIAREQKIFGGVSVGGFDFGKISLRDVDETFTRALPRAGRGPFEGLSELSKGVSKNLAITPKIKEQERTGLVMEKSEPSGQATAIFRQPTPKEESPTETFERKIFLIRNELNTGQISEKEAQERIRDLQKSKAFKETLRKTPAIAGESFGRGALVGVAPFIGIPLEIADFASLKPKEIVQSLRTTPGTTSLALGTGVLGGIAGGVAGSAARGRIKTTSATKLADDIDVKSTGKVRQKNILDVLEESGIAVRGQNQRITETNSYKVNIPITKNKKINMEIVEFTKNGIKNYYGRTIDDGKVISNIQGKAIVGAGDDALKKVISRFIEEKSGKKGTQVRVTEILDEIKTKGFGKKAGIIKTDTSVESRLSKKFDLEGLTPEQVRFIVRSELFSPEQAKKLRNKPFTQKEFSAAKKLSKSDIKSFLTQTDLKLSKIEESIGGIKRTRLIRDVRGKRIAAGKTKNLIDTSKLGKPSRRTQLGKVKGRRFDSQIIEKGLLDDLFKQTQKRKPRTPLSKTFREEPSTSLITKTKTKTKAKLKPETTTTGTVGALAKTVQRGAKSAFIKSRTKASSAKGLITGAFVGTRTGATAAQRERQKTKTKQKEETKTAQVDLIKTAPTTRVAQKEILKTSPSTAQALRTRTKQLQEERLATSTATATATTTRLKPSVTFAGEFPSTPSTTSIIGPRNIVLKGVKKANSYYPEAKHEGKYIRLSKKSMPIQHALSRGADAIDNSTSATFRLKPSRRKKDLEKTKNPNYFPRNRNKFRDYRISKGKKQQLRNKFIERKGVSRIDSPGEKRELSVARLKKQKGWGKTKSKKKRGQK